MARCSAMSVVQPVSAASLLPEERARVRIDAALERAGWCVQDKDQSKLYAAKGVAVREFPLKSGHGEADYLLFVEQQAVGVVEAKKEGSTLTGVELQSARYGAGLPDHLQTPVRPLPFRYESTGVETHFTNALDPEPRARSVFAFHTPETLLEWAEQGQDELEKAGGDGPPAPQSWGETMGGVRGWRRKDGGSMTVGRRCGGGCGGCRRFTSSATSR